MTPDKENDPAELVGDPELLISSLEWCVFEGPAGPENKLRPYCALRIRTKGGAEGASLLEYRSDRYGHLQSHDIAGKMETLLLGRNALDRDVLWDQMDSEAVPIGIINSVDIALWDLWGRTEEKPVHALLGTMRGRVKVYVSTRFDVGEPEAYRDFALRCKELGFHGYKIHPYINWDRWHERPETGGYPDRDMEVYRTVADVASPDFALMTDNFCTYGFEDALLVGRLVDELGYRWYESPMPETEDWMMNYVRLRRELKTPICAPELAPGTYRPRLKWMEAGACDINRTDLYYGGMTASLRLARACSERGIPLELHVGDAYQLQIMAVFPETLIEFYESFTTSREERLKPGKLTPEPVADAEGYMAVPARPGMGEELDWKYIRAHRVS